MTVSIQKDKQCFIVNFSGPLMASAYKKIIDVISHIIVEKDNNRNYVLLNFTKVTLITSVIMNAINERKEDLEKSGLSLVIIAPSDEKFEIFKLTGFDRIFPRYTNVEDFKRICNIK